MKSKGYVQPISATFDLWQQLARAKASRDRVATGDLSGKIRRATVEARQPATDEWRDVQHVSVDGVLYPARWDNGTLVVVTGQGNC